MVLMHRKDIIEQYGFDPGAGGGSVVPKSEGPTAAINVIPDQEELEPPSHETPSADLLPSMGAGVLKSFATDPAMLAGLGYGVYYWSKKRLQGEEDTEFAEGLYREGGLDNVKSHIQQKYVETKAANPDWDDAAVKEEIERYTGSEDFFNFNTAQMIPPLSAGLQLANRFNKELGVDKNPNQETFTDDVMQTLGSLLTPTGALKVGAVAKQFATKTAQKVVNDTVASGIGKAAGALGTVADYTVVPGVAKLDVPNVAGNVAGGMVVDEAVRHATGDPTVLPSGTAFAEFNKEQERLPLGMPQEHLAERIVPVDEAQLDPKLVSEVQQNTQQADLGATGLIAGGAAALLAARGAMRGRVPVTTPPAVPLTRGQDVEVRRAGTTGLNAPVDPNISHRGIESLDQKIDQYSPVYQLARELEVEDQITAEVGQLLSRGGQELQLRNVFEDGVLPNGHVVEPPRIYFDQVAGLDEATRQRHQQSIVAENILFELATNRTIAQQNLADAQAHLAANPTSNAAAVALQNATQTNTLWNQYHPSIRRYMPDADEAQLNQARYVRGQDPVQDELMDRYARQNETLNDLQLQAGLIDRATHTERSRNPYHTALWEHDPARPVAYDPNEPRSRSLDPVDVRVRNILSPQASLRLKFENATAAAARNLGLRNIHRVLSGADPQNREIREVPGGVIPEGIGDTGHFTYMRNGREVTVQTARPHVADAVNTSAIDDGLLVDVANTVRAAAQFGMVHGLAAVGQAPTSLFYDMSLGWLTQRAGTSIGYASRWLRQVERLTTTAGSIPAMMMSRFADLVDIVDIPGRMAAYGVTLAQAMILNGARALGQKLMNQAITRDGFFGHLANAIPNGHQMIGAIGGRMAAYFTASWAGHYRRFTEANSHQMLVDLNLTRDRIAADMRQWENGSPSGVRQRLRDVFTAYNAILNHVQSLHKMTAFAQQHALGADPRIAAEQSRRSAGDMAAQFGSPTLRKLGKTIPFMRIGMQSLRHLLHAMISRGAWDSSLVVTRLAAMGAASYGIAKILEENGLTDWYYEQLNDFERTGKLWIPKIEKWVNKFSTGDFQFDKSNPAGDFYTLSLPPEASLFNGTLNYGMEQFGLINRGSNRGNTSAEKDLLYSLGQTFNVGNIPLISAGAALAGYKTDFTAGLRGRSAITEIHGPKAHGGDLPSGIPTPAAEAFKALFGFNAMLLTQATDAGIQDYKNNKDVTSALARAWDEGKGLFVQKSAPSVPGLWDAKRKVYGITAMASEINRVNNVVDSVNYAYSNEFTEAGAKRGENRRRIVDPEVKKMLYATHSFFNRGAMLKMQERLSMLRGEVDNIKSSKGKANFDEIDQMETAKFKEMRPWHDRMMEHVQKYNAYLASRYGERFAKEGLEPNADNVVKLIKKYSQ